MSELSPIPERGFSSGRRRRRWQPMAVLKRYGDDAVLEACTRADHWHGSLTWHRIIDALERLMGKGPAEGEAVH